MAGLNPDFSGWATRNDLRCSDGRVIRDNAFAHQDKAKVPLVWQHGHNDMSNVIGHALLENRGGKGVYAYGFLNSSDKGDLAREMLEHGDINSLSIFANRLTQKGPDVVHGNIVEVSLVLAGANPGAVIENVTIQHSDGSYTDSPDEAIIHANIPIDEVEDPDMLNDEINNKSEETEVHNTIQHADDQAGSETIGDVYNSMPEKYKTVLHYMLAVVAGGNAAPSAAHSDTYEDYMTHANIFEPSVGSGNFAFINEQGDAFSHSDIEAIASETVAFARDRRMNLKDAVLQHAAKEYGISNIEMLFPNAKTDGKPTWVKPEDEWVKDVVDGTSHTPFARLKSMQIDLTEDKLRAKGYITADQKKDGVFRLLSRETTPQTIYVRSKLDRDDILDASDHDVVAYTKEAMRTKFRYELACAILVGDGRQASDKEKIKEDHVRPIYNEDDFYASKFVVPATVKNEDMPERILRAQKNFKGSGVPTLFTTYDVYMDMLLAKDEANSNRRLYTNDSDLCAAMHVSKIVVVDALEGKQRTVSGKKQDLIGIIVNMKDYNIGRDKGGDVFNAEDFDIDFNQYKYLMETRLSGALTEPKTAIVVERLAAS